MHMGNFMIQPNGKKCMLLASSVSRSAGMLDLSTIAPPLACGTPLCVTGPGLDSETGQEARRWKQVDGHAIAGTGQGGSVLGLSGLPCLLQPQTLVRP